MLAGAPAARPPPTWYSESSREAHLSTLEAGPQASAWISRPYGNRGRSQGSGQSPRQGPQAPVRLSPIKDAGVPAMPSRPGMPDSTGVKPGRLKRRAEFLRAAASGNKAAVGGVVLQALARSGTLPARLEFTVTRKVGNAVVRNHTRRRLKEAVRLVLNERPVAGVDLVLIGRDSTRKRDFMALQSDIRRALDKAGVS